MARIGIPRPVFPGIKIISELNQEDMQKLTGYISNLPIEIEFETVVQELDSLLKVSGHRLLQTILSFKDLVNNFDENSRVIAENLVESFIEYSKEDLDSEKKKTLENNLYQILSNFDSVNDIMDAREITTSNENNFSDGSVITDLRLIFKENSEEKNRATAILHKLHIEYNNGTNLKELYLTLDIKDLNKLKVQIEKAIQKDQIIREDYKDVLNFLF